MTAGGLRPARLRASDMLRLGTAGLRARPLRAVLAALGIAVGVAAMLSIVGISASSSAEIRLEIDRLGPNLLEVTPGRNLQDQVQPLPIAAAALIGRIGPVTSTTQLGQLPLAVYRNDHVPTGQTDSLSVAAATPSLLPTLRASLAVGSWYTASSSRIPTVVLGSTAAQRLGIRGPGVDVWLGGRWCAVVGVLDPVAVAPAVDASALLGWPAARRYFGFDGHPTTVYVRTEQAQVDAVAAIVARSVSPAAPQYVALSRPTDAIAARRAATAALSGLLLGLVGVALLIGGIGIANTMVVSILERRSEIGLRRSLGATRGQIRTQFVAEATLLSVLGGAAGTVVGIVVTEVYAYVRSWPATVPVWAAGAGLGATMAIGAIAGWLPAVRAGRLSPTEALTAL